MKRLMFVWILMIGGMIGVAREGWAVTVIKSTRLAYSDDDDGGALPNLLSRIDSLSGYDVIDGGYKTITELGNEIYSNTLLFITGHWGFSFSDVERNLLKSYLENGGLIWGDDCNAYNSVFASSFDAEMYNMFGAYTSVLPTTHSVFSSYYILAGGNPPAWSSEPLRGLNVNGRTASFLSLNDYGCGLNGEGYYEESCQMGVNIALSNVPEPSSLLLIGAGLVSLIRLRRRRYIEMKKKFLVGLVSGMFLVVITNMANATPLSNIIYSNDFETAVGPNWTDNNRTTDSYGGFVSTYYHGNYTTNGNTTLSITNLPSHTNLALEFDLYLFWTWDGENTYWGKDYFSLSGDINGAWTFTNHQPQGQSYPGTPDETYGPSGASQTHIYRELDPTGFGDRFLIAHTGDVFTVTFGGPTTQDDEWWGIDNVRVSVDAVPEPSSLLLIGAGLVGLVRLKRKKRK